MRIGENILHYKILNELGRGGMGVVYKAEDTRLGRTVALKFLSPHLTQDAGARARFIQEAQAASALEHPNLCTIYSIDEAADGQTFICMAYYQGETLQAKIAASGNGNGSSSGSGSSSGIEIAEAVDIATQIAAGLARAHEAGIIHRDIKPSNIIVTDRGEVKILDFGIAKLAGQAQVTRTGATLGTVAYMSPEQLQGEIVDQRTDIWSLGVVLYEMLTGQVPFRGEIEQATMFAIVSDDPAPVASLNSEVPAVLEAVVSQALAKECDARYQDIHEMLIDLQRVQKCEPVPATPMSGRRKRRLVRSVARFAVIATMIVVAVVAGLFVFKPLPTPKLPSKHSKVTFSGNVYLNEAMNNQDVSALSPDGQFLAYILAVEGDSTLMIMDLSGGQTLEIVSGIKYCSSLKWSPDGKEIMFWDVLGDTLNNLFIFPRLGGKPRILPPLPYACWSPDGRQIAGAAQLSQMIKIVDRSTGDLVNQIDLGDIFVYRDLQWSHEGNRLVFVGFDPSKKSTGGIWTVSLAGQLQKIVAADPTRLYSPRWSADSRAIYYLSSNGLTSDLMKIKVSFATGRPVDAPDALQTGLQAYGFTLSRNDKLLNYTKFMSYSNLWLVTPPIKNNAVATQTRKLTQGTQSYNRPALSPDGAKLAFTVDGDIHVMDMESGQTEQITYLDSYCRRPHWSPDGKEIAFSSSGKMWIVASAGGVPRVFEETAASADNVWTPDGHILYQRSGNSNLHLLNPETQEETPLLRESHGWLFQPQISPDGKRVVVYWNRSDAGAWILSLEGDEQTLLRRNRVFPLKWSNDGAWIYAWDVDKKPVQILKLPANGGEPVIFAELPFENIPNGGISLSADGKTIVCNVQETLADVWLLENFDPELQE